VSKAAPTPVKQPTKSGRALVKRPSRVKSEGLLAALASFLVGCQCSEGSSFSSARTASGCRPSGGGVTVVSRALTPARGGFGGLVVVRRAETGCGLGESLSGSSRRVSATRRSP